jgi:hypothetical protein
VKEAVTDKRKKMARRILNGLVYEKKPLLQRPVKYKLPEKKGPTQFVENGDVIEDLASGKKMKVKFQGKEMTFIPMS